MDRLLVFAGAHPAVFVVTLVVLLFAGFCTVAVICEAYTKRNIK